MLRDRIIKAWKDPEFRTSLSVDDLAELPENPAGAIELTDDELDMATGGSWGGSSQRPSSSSPSSNSSSNVSSYSSRNSASNSSSNSASSASASSASASSASASSRPRLQPYTSSNRPKYSSTGSARWK